MHPLRNSILFLITAYISSFGTSVSAAENVLETAAIEYKSVTKQRVLDGVVQAVHHSTLSSQINARVSAIYFDIDDHVRAGELILEFDDTAVRAKLRQAEAEFLASQAKLTSASTDFSRIDKLKKSNTVAQSVHDSARVAVDEARARVAAARAIRDQSLEQLSYTKVLAPYSGIVTKRHIQLGETAVQGTPLMSGFSLEELRVEVNFPQRLISNLDKDDLPVIELGGATNNKITATEVTIFPYADTKTSTIPMRLSLPTTTQRLYPGMLVKVAFSTGNRLRLGIPGNAVVYRSEVVGTYVVSDSGNISFRHIRVGNMSDDGSLEVLAGLDDGERVAINPTKATRLAIANTSSGSK
jgi:membrane fusion protein, multidrug efflux system